MDYSNTYLTRVITHMDKNKMNVQTNNWINVIHSTLHLQPSRFNRGESLNFYHKTLGSWRRMHQIR